MTKIAPKSKGCESWTSEDWYKANKSNDWDTMIQIFRDRVDGRYLNFIRDMNERPYSGFAVMTLGCPLLETLHQFYKGLRNSPRRNNDDFYVQFLTQSSFVFKDRFKDNMEHAKTFYDHFRCGLIHQAETKGGSKILRKKGELLFEPTKDGLFVYRKTLVDLLVQEIDSYIGHLNKNDDPTWRKNFIRKMNYICNVEFEDLEN
jgi:hypothetical protein